MDLYFANAQDSQLSVTGAKENIIFYIIFNLSRIVRQIAVSSLPVYEIPENVCHFHSFIISDFSYRRRLVF